MEDVSKIRFAALRHPVNLLLCRCNMRKAGKRNICGGGRAGGEMQAATAKHPLFGAFFQAKHKQLKTEERIRDEASSVLKTCLNGSNLERITFHFTAEVGRDMRWKKRLKDCKIWKGRLMCFQLDLCDCALVPWVLFCFSCSTVGRAIETHVWGSRWRTGEFPCASLCYVMLSVGLICT